MEFNLIPLPYSNFIQRLKTIGITGILFTVLLFLAMVFSGCFQDIFTPILLAMLFLAISAVPLIPGMLYEKISHSIVIFGSDEIRIISKAGHCWRKIPYCSITKVCVREITGFFYGEIKHSLKHSYICLFLNGETEIPKLSYSKMFAAENFFMMAFQPDALQSLQRNMTLHNSAAAFNDPDG